MKSRNQNTIPRNTYRGAFLIALAIMGIYLFMAACTTLWDRDEPRYARVAVEMVDSGNYLVPTFNGRKWFDKPPLLYWLMSLPIRRLGPTEFACRFFGAVGTALTCLLTFLIGQQLFGTKAGLWAMVILASTLMVSVTGGAATPDAVLLPFIVAAIVISAHTICSGMRLSHVLLMGAALGLGMLTKGPIGLMPIPAIATMLWLDRKSGTSVLLRVRSVLAALGIGLLIFAAWAFPANSASDGEFLRVFIGRHVINRAFRPMEHHGGNLLLYLPYYLPVIVVGFFPWTLHLLGAFSAVAGGRVGGKHGRIVLFGWIVPTFILMTLAATKLPHYILFIWPALALAVAGTIDAAQQDKLIERDKIWLRRGVWFFGPLAIVIALGLMAGPWFLQLPGARWPGLASGIVLLAMTAIAIHQQRANRPQVSARILLVCMLVFGVFLFSGVLPAFEHIKISPPIAQAIKENTSKQTPVATYKYGEPTLGFYVGRPIEPLRSEEAVVEWAKRPTAGVLVIPNNILDAIQERHGTLRLDKIASKKGFNYSKGKTLEVVALRRH